MKRKINNELNNAWNKASKGMLDCPMWCDLVADDTAYLAWHVSKDGDILPKDFQSAAIVIFATFKNINVVSSPFWKCTRKWLENAIHKSKRIVLGEFA